MRQEQIESSGKSALGQTGCVGQSTAAPAAAPIAVAADTFLLDKLMEAVGNPPVDIVLWNGVRTSCRDKPAVARLFVRDRAALLHLVANPEFGFGEMYTAERVDVQGDLADFLEALYRALPKSSGNGIGQKFLATLNDARRNTLTGARRNIHHHYDIGNNFYKLWLDPQMVYTCAYFPSQSMDLSQAQSAKLDYVCRKLRLQPGEEVVEAGCGWGALALHMAKTCGVRVRAYNISKEQIAFARERARAEGLADRVEFIEDDYRNIRGQCDAFVSVGMLEHIGTAHYQQLGAVVESTLKAGGRGLIHSIGRDYPSPMNAWIERHIFPGACPPSLSQMMQIFEPCGLSVLDVENLRLHYARTLEYWLQNYENAATRVEAMFDPGFVRTWRLYLAGSVAAFRSGSMQLFQVIFSRSGHNDIPWTRHYQYVD